MERMIPYGKQYIDQDDINAVIEVLQGDYLTTGPHVKKFEENFADYVGAKFAVAVSSGTAALHLACLAAGIGKDQEVITSPVTFAASANCALYIGSIPVFADINPSTINIDTNEIRKKINSQTRAIIPVHFTGLPCEMKEIQSIARENDLTIIEDACHALGAGYRGSTIGDCSYSDMTVFSFHPVKHITTGEGGMITTNSEIYYRRLMSLRTHGIIRDSEYLEYESHGGWYYEMQDLGYNYRLTDIQSALGISQLKKLNFFLKRRREIAATYSQMLKELPLILPHEPDYSQNAYHLYVVRVKDSATINRSQLYSKLRDRGILCQVHYIPVHTMPYYKRKLGYRLGDFPAAEEYYQRALSLPVYPGMSGEDLEFVIKNIKELLT